MKKCLFMLMLAFVLAVPVSAAEYTAPQVPDSGTAIMPETDSFSDGLWNMLQKAVSSINPDFHEAVRISAYALSAVILIGVIQAFCDGADSICEIAGVMAISALMLLNTKGMIRLASETVTQISEYGKLLLPVMTGALAAQGGISSSAALYAGTTMFSALLSAFLSKVLCPMIYLFLALAVGSGAVGEGILKNMRDTVKIFASWCLKVLLTVFTTYMSLTGVISGTTDAAALKATKVAMSSFVPVVGSILSDASEAVLLSAGLAKNAAGIYGILAVLAVFLVPFLRIGIHYIVLKVTYAICAIVGSKRMSELIGDFSTAMGLLLAMTGSACLLQLISTVCFLKGVG